jgi:hypothetical protein
MKKPLKIHVKNIYPLVMGLLFLTTYSAFAWSMGHDYVNRKSIEIMPLEIKNFLGEENLKKLILWSHSPDSFTPFDIERKKKNYPITDDEIAYLKSFKAKSLYYLHSTHKPGQGGNFILLIKAFMDKDPERSAFWMSTLMHTIADDSACNHTPQIHYFTYAFRRNSLKKGNGIGFDFADVAKTKEGQKAVDEILAGYKPKVISNDPQAALMQILRNDTFASTYGTQREFKIIATYSLKASPETRLEGIKAMAELGCYGMTKTIDFITTAWKLAQENKIPELTEEDFKKTRQARRAYFMKQPLSDDSIYTDLLCSLDEKQTPSVGVLLDRSGIMMSRKLSFGGRLVMAAAMRTMKKQGISYVTIDLRDLSKADSRQLDPAEIPVLTLCAGPWAVSGNVKNNLKKYVENGGHLLWVGGVDGGVLGNLSKKLVKADPAILPVTQGYGCKNKDVIDKIALRFLPPLSMELGTGEFQFVNNPDTPTGSQKPVCLLKVNMGDNNIKPLAELLIDDRKIVVAAALMEGEIAKAVFLPEYLIAPFILDKSVKTEHVDIAYISLDKVGAPLFLNSLKLLGINMSAR